MQIVVGWLVPGGGYLLTKRYRRFTLCFAMVCVVFAGGVALGGLHNPPQPGFFGVAAAAAQWLSGGPFLIARVFSHAPLPIDTPVHEYGAALLMTAGMINLLALADTD